MGVKCLVRVHTYSDCVCRSVNGLEKKRNCSGKAEVEGEGADQWDECQKDLGGSQPILDTMHGDYTWSVKNHTLHTQCAMQVYSCILYPHSCIHCICNS